MLHYSTFVENRIKNIQATDAFVFASAVGVAPWVVPLGPAIIFSYALYKSAPVGMPDNLRILAASAVGCALVVAGAVSSHNAIQSKNRTWPWSLVGIYIFLEIAGLWAMGGVTGDIKIIGTVASLLTLIVYLSRANAKLLDETKAIEQIKLEYQLEQARLNASLERQLKRDRQQMTHEQNMAKINKSVTVSDGVSSVSQTVSKKLSEQDIKARLKTELDNGKPNMTQLAAQFGIARSTLYRYKNEMVGNGNGKG